MEIKIGDLFTVEYSGDNVIVYISVTGKDGDDFIVDRVTHSVLPANMTITEGRFTLCDINEYHKIDKSNILYTVLPEMIRRHKASEDGNFNMVDLFVTMFKNDPMGMVHTIKNRKK
jgi:hypothetical protein